MDNRSDFLQQIDFICIDTSSLMETDKLEKFIKNYDSIIKDINKKIVVQEGVVKELKKHIDSSDEGKKNKADQAYKIIAKNNQLFDLEATIDSVKNYKNYFYDKDVLKFLEKKIEEKISEVLFITYDNSLGQDALNIFSRTSYKHAKGFVKKINENGELENIRKKYSKKSYEEKLGNIIKKKSQKKEESYTFDKCHPIQAHKNVKTNDMVSKSHQKVNYKKILISGGAILASTCIAVILRNKNTNKSSNIDIIPNIDNNKTSKLTKLADFTNEVADSIDKFYARRK